MNLVEKISDGVFLQVRDGQASIHSLNATEDFQITPQDESRASDILQILSVEHGTTAG
ncbi:MAG: hypothetical protein ACYC2R_09195 [Burkholderiales bacterium]